MYRMNVTTSGLNQCCFLTFHSGDEINCLIIINCMSKWFK